MNKLNTLNQGSIENRVCQRLTLERDLKLYLFNERTLECKSTDISLGGINLKLDSKLHHIFLGTDASITIDDAHKIFKCTIVRINDDELAVEVNKKQAASFGMALTQNMFKHVKRKKRN